MLISLVGVAVGAYLTYAHYTDTQVACTDTGLINCGAVLNSSFSVVLGIPLAVLLLVWFIVFASLVFYKEKGVLMNMWLIVGVGGVAYSTMSMYLIGKVCVWCLSMDVLIILSVILVLIY